MIQRREGNLCMGRKPVQMNMGGRHSGVYVRVSRLVSRGGRPVHVTVTLGPVGMRGVLTSQHHPK